MKSRKTSELSNSEVDQLYRSYKQTYEKIGGKLYTEEEFKSKIHRGYYNKLVEKMAEDKSFTNYLMVWSHDKGRHKKICLVFGDEGDAAAKDRTNLVKMTIATGMGYYIEASGPLGKRLLEDENVAVSLMAKSDHYYAKNTAHGKKIIFGTTSDAVEINREARKFIFYLYEYNKIKISRLSGEDKIRSLNRLYDTVLKEKDMPRLYQLIMLSKLARKMDSLTPGDESIAKKISFVSEELKKAKVSEETVKDYLVIQQNLPDQAQELVKEALKSIGQAFETKRNTLLGKMASSTGKLVEQLRPAETDAFSVLDPIAGIKPAEVERVSDKELAKLPAQGEPEELKEDKAFHYNGGVKSKQ